MTQVNDRDAEQLRLLSIFHYVYAALVGLVGIGVPILYFLGGLAMLAGVGGQQDKDEARVVGVIVMVVAFVVVVVGLAYAALVAFAGRCLAQRKARIFVFLMACFACLSIPLGTALGAFTIAVLMRPSVKELFESRA